MGFFWSGEFWTGSVAVAVKTRKKNLRSQVRFPFFLFLKLLKTILGFFWSGEFWTGSGRSENNKKQQQKKEKTLRSQVRFPFFFCLKLLKTTLGFFWSGEF